MTKSFSIHTGYLYSTKSSFGFASISSVNDHKAEAVHAALKPIIEWCQTNSVSKITFVSDSTVAQYRNMKNVFLVRSLAKESGITCQWLFTEAGHGKSVCDGIGGNLKTRLKDITAFNTSHVTNTPEDLLGALQPASDIQLSVCFLNSYDVRRYIQALLSLYP